MSVPFFHMVAFPDQFLYLNHIIQHELLHLQFKSHSELSLIIRNIQLNLTDTLSKTDVTKPCLTVCTSLCLQCAVQPYSTLLYPALVSQCLPSLNLAFHKQLIFEKTAKIPNMVEMAVFFLLLWSLLAMALTSKHLSLANIIS